MRFFKRKITVVILLISFVATVLSAVHMPSVNAAEPVVVVIDPGHGLSLIHI